MVAGVGCDEGLVALDGMNDDQAVDDVGTFRDSWLMVWKEEHKTSSALPPSSHIRWEGLHRDQTPALIRADIIRQDQSLAAGSGPRSGTLPNWLLSQHMSPRYCAAILDIVPRGDRHYELELRSVNCRVQEVPKSDVSDL